MTVAAVEDGTLRKIPPPTPLGTPPATPVTAPMAAGVGAAAAGVLVYSCTRASAICGFAAPFAWAMARLCDAIDVPRTGAQPPEMFQLPSLSWFFSIFATHF